MDSGLSQLYKIPYMRMGYNLLSLVKINWFPDPIYVHKNDESCC